MAFKINPNSERPRKKQGTGTKVFLRKKGGPQERILCNSFIPKVVTALRRIWYLKKALISTNGVGTIAHPYAKKRTLI